MGVPIFGAHPPQPFSRKWRRGWVFHDADNADERLHSVRPRRNPNARDGFANRLKIKIEGQQFEIFMKPCRADRSAQLG